MAPKLYLLILIENIYLKVHMESATAPKLIFAEFAEFKEKILKRKTLRLDNAT